MASKAIGFLNFKFGADLKGFDRAMKKAQKNLKKFGKNVERTGKNLTTGLTLPIAALGASSIKAFDAQEKAIAQVEAGLKSTGDTVGFTSEKLQQMASDLQKTTLFGDEEILKGATAQLLTFTNITGEQFAKTQEIALDLATRLDGDLKSASIMLGKALNDPIANLSALGRAGIQFSTEQKETIKSLVETNELADAQTIILAELEKQYGGSAEAAALVGLGPIKQLQNQLSDLSEQIGERLIPHVQSFVGWITKLAEKFDGLSESQKDSIVKWGLIVAAIGPALIIFGKIVVGASGLIKLFVGLRTAVLATSGAFKVLTVAMVKNPIGAVIALLTTAAAAYFLLGNETKKASRAQKEFNGVTESSEDAVKRLSKSINDMGKDSFQMQIEEIEDLIKKIKGFEIKPSQFTKGVALSDKQKKEIQDLNMLLFRLKQKQADAKKEADDLDKSLNNLGVTAKTTTGEFAKLDKETEEFLDNYKLFTSRTQEDVPKLSHIVVPDLKAPTIQETGWDVFYIQLGFYMDRFKESWEEIGPIVNKVFSGITDVVSAASAKETRLFENEKKRKETALDDEYDKRKSYIENTIIDEEAKNEAIAKLDAVFAGEKNDLNEEMAIKEKDIKKKQAKRNKAIALMDAIVNTASSIAEALPNLPLALATGALGAAQIGIIASTPIPEFKEGGIVSGPTLGIMGEYSNAKSNPEVIAPLDKLKNMIGGDNQKIEVVGRLIGNDIYLSNEKTAFNRLRTT